MSATDGASNVVTNNYQVGVTGPSSSSLTFDANGNMTSDGTNTYAWDAEDRLIKITYPGSGNYSQILYDANGIKGQVTETVASTLTSTKQFVNSGSRIVEERDAINAVIKNYFGLGQTISGSNYFYALDHLGSVRDMTDTSGVVQAHYEYDLYGQRTKTAGALDSDFQYAGYYMHAPSGLNLTVYRAYSPSQERWINRDPIEESGGVNLYNYCGNATLNNRDTLGLDQRPGMNCLGAFCQTLATFPDRISPFNPKPRTLNEIVTGYGWHCRKINKCDKCECNGKNQQAGVGMAYDGYSDGFGASDGFDSPWPKTPSPPDGPDYHFLTQQQNGKWSGYEGYTPTYKKDNYKQYDSPADYNHPGTLNSIWCCCRERR
ncbi:MAG: RHS repeat-associated core domain-containing protein [Candidatus Obscuribacterales bacterium]|nr:RHS repeat-associated core domain-containing protein [Candidatus Obscuribacterales bacterium]